MKISATILAAGSSNRMGDLNKLLLLINERPIINLVCTTALETNLNPIVVVTGYQHIKVEKAIPNKSVRLVHNKNWKMGMMSSICLGISVLDVQLKRIDYNSQVQSKLFNRMRSEQNMIAEKYRAQGQCKKQEILGLQIQEEKTILSEAYKKAQKIRGDADAYAIKTYSEAYEQRKNGKVDQDAVEFYEFLKSLDAYENIFDSSTRLILSTDSQFFKYLK